MTVPTSRSQHARHRRESLRAAGYRLASFWVPDARRPQVAAECDRQCLLIEATAGGDADLDRLNQDHAHALDQLEA